MDPVDLTPQLDQLAENVDDLQEALRPLLKNALSDTAANMPLLDKAKLYVLMVYSIESLLFSYLKLNDIDAKTHPVFQELTRVKQYYQKIADLEKPPERPKVILNKDAAGRVMTHALAGNAEYDRQRTQQQELLRATAQMKLDQLSKKRKHVGQDQHQNQKKAMKKKKNKQKRNKKGSQQNNQGEAPAGDLETKDL